LPFSEIGQLGTSSSVDRSLLATLLTGEYRFVPLQIGFAEFVEIWCVFLGLLLRSEDSGERRLEECADEIRVFDWSTIERMANAVQTSGKKLCLLSNTVCDGGCKFAR
jgi:hypothetical protein